MRLLHAIAEDEMIAVFLKTEMNSARFEAEILRLLQSDRTARSIVDMPDLSDPAANAYRRKLFGDYRIIDTAPSTFSALCPVASILRFLRRPNDKRYNRQEMP